MQIIEENDAYNSKMEKASGMGQIRGMSVFSSDTDEEIKVQNVQPKDPRLIHPTNPSN